VVLSIARSRNIFRTKAKKRGARLYRGAPRGFTQPLDAASADQLVFVGSEVESSTPGPDLALNIRGEICDGFAGIDRRAPGS
jgi:hypothetical protein